MIDHSITSSAPASSVVGTSRPSAFAVLRLITSSYLVGACTGKSPGCGYSHGHTLANQIGRKLRQSIELPVSPAKFERNVLAFDVSGLLEALAKSAQILREGYGRCGVQKSDHRHRRLLRARRERPCSRAAEQRDELAPLHSITSSAATSSLSGTVRPSIRAVWWLMTNSNLVDCTTGRSAGFAPLRMRPV